MYKDARNITRVTLPKAYLHLWKGSRQMASVQVFAHKTQYMHSETLMMVYRKNHAVATYLNYLANMESSLALSHSALLCSSSLMSFWHAACSVTQQEINRSTSLTIRRYMKMKKDTTIER
jgi:hypothetical protein